jgi:hypothetical protein
MLPTNGGQSDQAVVDSSKASKSTEPPWRHNSVQQKLPPPRNCRRCEYSDSLLPAIGRHLHCCAHRLGPSPIVAASSLVAAVVFGAYGTALGLVRTQLPILPLRLYSLISEQGTDFPAAAALALLITAVCSAVLTCGEWIGSRNERHL